MGRKFGERFGLLKKNGNIKIGLNNSVPPNSEASVPQSEPPRQILAEETPAPLSSQPNIVLDTPFQQNCSSPILQERSSQRDLTIESEDAIFGDTRAFSPSVLEPIKFQSVFAASVDQKERQRKRESINLTTNQVKRKHIVLASPSEASSSDDSRVTLSPGIAPDKEPDNTEQAAALSTPLNPKNKDPDGFESVRTKGQKNKDRKKKKKEASKASKKMKEF